MKEIISPIAIDKIEAELTPDKFLRKTNACNNSIYVITAHNSPNLMLELGRLRELTFREAGGGTGEEVDIDRYDTADLPFKQLIVWNDDEKEIVSSYRFILGKEAPLDENGYPQTPTAKLFKYSQKFIDNEWQDTIELGRSFVQPKYQGTQNPRLGLFSLDNLWDGLGTLTIDYPEAKYFFGKMTMYDSYNRMARNWILQFLNRCFKGDETLVTPISPAVVQKTNLLFKTPFKKGSFKEDFKILNDNIRNLKESIPPLIKSYVNLSSTMQYFGAAANPEFGPVEEIAILINIADIYDEKKKRHVQSYKKQAKDL